MFGSKPKSATAVFAACRRRQLAEPVAGKQNRTFLVVLSPVVQVPVELEKLIVVLDHDLPSREQLEQIARGIASGDNELPSGSELQTVLEAASGLTRYEAEGAFSLSVARHGRITNETLWELKSQTLRKSGLLQLHRGEAGFDSLGSTKSLAKGASKLERGAAIQYARRPPAESPREVVRSSRPHAFSRELAKVERTMPQIPSISRGVRTHSGHVTTLTTSTLRPELKMPGKHSYSQKNEDKSRSGDQQRDHLRRYNGISAALGTQQP